ncbi:Protein phosphatase 2C homolog 1 (PP2C-1) [Durusdinium trenchii]|uniref:Protein phosphatase 2C homolog 1 (PP2C-1) n=1 Tax=Durusdinium trenchii TaxID=1381693 RepID=A0ABP0Q2S0_9DINO
MGFAHNPVAVHAVGWAEDQGRRAEMEDGFVFVDQFGGQQRSAFFAVYDGHGGRPVVDFVTRELHENLYKELRRTGSPADALLQAFRLTDEDMLRRKITSSGCTACCCLLQDEARGRVIYTAHLGDSRAVLARSGSATRMTSMTDHKATDPLEAKRVIEAGGQIINDRVNGMLAMTRALGDHMLKMPMLANDVVSNVPDITSTDVTKQEPRKNVGRDAWEGRHKMGTHVNMIQGGTRMSNGRSAASMRVAALAARCEERSAALASEATGLATFHHTPRGLHAGVVHAVSAACAEERPRWLRQREEVALAWKPEGWEDVRSKSRTRRKAPEPRRDFLEWAQEEWPTSAEQPRPSTKDVLPLFTLGRRNSGISLLVKCRHGQQTVMQWQKEGLIATRVALLVEGRLDDLLLRRLRERDGLEVSTLRRSEGLRHGCLSLLQVRVNSAPVEAVATLRRRFSEEGHPLRGPTGGKAVAARADMKALQF